VVIEDNPADANLIREAFQEHAIRCELVMVPNGERAVEFIDRIDAAGLPGPGLIILDLNLPRVHGRDVLRHIRSSKCCELTPIIVLTSSRSHQDRNEALALGASQYLSKPLRLLEFLELGAIFKATLNTPPAGIQ